MFLLFFLNVLKAQKASPLGEAIVSYYSDPSIL